MSNVLDARIKQKQLVYKFDISNLIKNFDLNTKLKTIATKADLKAEQNKTAKVIFLEKNIFGDVRSQNPMDTSSSIRHRFDVKIPHGKFVEILSVLKGKSTWKL